MAVEDVRSSDLAQALADTTSTVHRVGAVSLPWDGSTVELGDLLLVSGERLHLIGVRTYAMVGGQADPAKVAATSRELAVQIVALRDALVDPTASLRVPF